MKQKIRNTWLLLYAALGLFCAAAFFPPIAAASDQQCKLELIRMEATRPGTNPPREEHIFRRVSQQRFTLHLKSKNTSNPYDREFKKIVKKEPDKYVSDQPFRGVAHFASKPYAFVLDKKEKSSENYDRLYFDINGNGDLTDDEPIDAFEQPPKKKQTTKENVAKKKITPQMIHIWSNFPRVDMLLDVDGKEIDYSFFFSAYLRKMKNYAYLMASFSSAAYRRGEATLDGKKQPVVLLDSNSNGRFDDMLKIPNINPNSRGRLRPSYGDTLLIGREKATAGTRRNVQQFSSQSLSKLTIIGGKYFDMKVTPSGDEIAWTGSDQPRGMVTCPHKDCKVTLVSDMACIPLVLKDSKPATVPAGQWRIFMYNITDNDWGNPKDKKPDDTKKNARARSAPSYISGWGTCQMEPIEVRPDETTSLKFGPPYKLSLRVYHMPGQERFSMAIKGETGEDISAIMLKGRRPPKPKITITDQKGEVVQQGNFEYG